MDELQIALETRGSNHPRTDHLVQVAQLLRPDMPISESQRSATKARMMLAARAAFADTEADEAAGTQDPRTSGEYEVHAAEVQNGAGTGRVILGDLEAIDPMDAQLVAFQATERARAIRAARARR